jgi:uncharacterized protein YjiK
LPALVLAASALSGCSAATGTSIRPPSPLCTSWRDIGGRLPPGFEPSGATWQTRTERLLVVSDKGMIAEMDAEGGSLRTWTLPGDLEGVCVADPATDRVYVARERPPGIVEYDLAEGRVVRVIPFPGLEDDGPKKKKNKGPEALTFVADSRDPEGGLFWAGLQGDGTVRVLSLPLRSRPNEAVAREIRRFAPRPGHTDLSALYWDPAAGKIWAVYDKDDLVVVLDKDGRVQETWMLSGEGQEGIAVIPGRVFLADDTARRVMRCDRAQD